MDSPRTFLLMRCLVPLTLVAMAGCGTSGGSTTAPPANTANFTATVDGSSWASTTLSTVATISPGGAFAIAGSPLSSGALGMGISLFHIAGPGSYPLGVGGSVPGGTASLTLGATGWWTGLTGASGTIVISAVSTTRIAGTFSYSAEPFFGGVLNTRTVTQGVFDLPVTGTGNLTVPPNAGSKFGGTLGGQPWNAATIAMVTKPSSGILGVGISNKDYQISLFISGWTGAGTYTMGTGVSRNMSVTSTTGTLRTWGGGQALSSGSVIVTSSTTSRVAGTYDVTLQPGIASPGPGPLRLTGAFDFGIP